MSRPASRRPSAGYATTTGRFINLNLVETLNRQGRMTQTVGHHRRKEQQRSEAAACGVQNAPHGLRKEAKTLKRDLLVLFCVAIVRQECMRPLSGLPRGRRCRVTRDYLARSTLLLVRQTSGTQDQTTCDFQLGFDPARRTEYQTRVLLTLNSYHHLSTTTTS